MKQPVSQKRAERVQLNLLITREVAGGKGVWVAQCLEHDICVQGPNIPILRQRLKRMLLGQQFVSKERGIQLFAGIRPARALYQRAFKRGSGLELSPETPAKRPARTALLGSRFRSLPWKTESRLVDRELVES